MPKYLLPRGMQVANQSRRKRRKRNNNNRGTRRMDNDPLQSYDGNDVNLDNVMDEDNAHGGDGIGGDEFDDPLGGEVGDSNNDEFVNNKSTAGRVKWQEKHKRGKFSKKFRKKEEGKLGF